MMRFLFVTVLMAIVTWFALVVMPWWIVMPLAFLLILIIPMKSWKSFVATGLGTVIIYLILTIGTDQANEHILSTRMAQLFHMPSYGFMIAVTALVGFITAGLGGWTAAALRNLLRAQKSKEEISVSQKSQA